MRLSLIILFLTLTACTPAPAQLDPRIKQSFSIIAQKFGEYDARLSKLETPPSLTNKK